MSNELTLEQLQSQIETLQNALNEIELERDKNRDRVQELDEIIKAKDSELEKEKKQKDDILELVKARGIKHNQKSDEELRLETVTFSSLFDELNK